MAFALELVTNPLVSVRKPCQARAATGGDGGGVGKKEEKGLGQVLLTTLRETGCDLFSRLFSEEKLNIRVPGSRVAEVIR